MLGAYPHQLSGGQRQRVGIAAAIAAGPALLIADEPTSALDTIVQAEIVRLIDALVRETGMSLLIVSHDIALAATIADRIVGVEGWRHCRDRRHRSEIVFRATGRLHADPCWQPASTLARRHFRDRRCRQRDDRRLLLGDPACERPSSAAQAGLPRLTASTFELAHGETLALVGPSGSGKSTLARVVLRLLEPDAGTLALRGEDLLALRGARLRAMRRRLQMVFQDPLAAFNPRATVERVLDDPLRIHAIADRRRAARGDRRAA